MEYRITIKPGKVPVGPGGRPIEEVEPIELTLTEEDDWVLSLDALFTGTALLQVGQALDIRIERVS